MATAPLSSRYPPRLIEAALKIRRELFGDQHPGTAASLNSYARVLRSQGDLRSAELTGSSIPN